MSWFMSWFGRTKVVALAAALLAVSVLASTASAQQEPPFRFYGTVDPGDVIGATGAYGNGDYSATADDQGEWFIDVDRDSHEGMSFTLNGDATEASLRSTGAGQAEVTLTVIAVEEDDSMMSDDEDSMMSDDDSMMEEDGDEAQDGAQEDDELQFPATGTGGLAERGVSTAALVGAALSLLAVVVAGCISLRRYASVKR